MQKSSAILSPQQLQSLPTIDEIDWHLQATYFDHFILRAWEILEPATPFISNWHIEAISEHLMAILNGELLDLIINIPPRFMKSLLVSVMFPAFTWIDRPHIKFLCSSYAADLSTRDSRKCRTLVQSPWYHAMWHYRNSDKENAEDREFYLVDDQNQKTRFDNNFTGYRIATTVGGSNTGEGGDIILTDDPNNIKKAESEADRNSVNGWWKEVMSTRGNDPKTAARVVIQQRTHDLDLTGFILKEDLGYTVLRLPNKYEKKAYSYMKGDHDKQEKRTVPKITSIGFKDPRVVDGELLWPGRYDKAATERLEKALGPYATAGQLQQRPTPRGGGMFKVDKFRRVDEFPVNWKIESIVRFFDKAGTEGAGKRTAGVKLCKFVNGRFGVMDVIKGQWGAGEREQQITTTMEMDGYEVSFGIEQEPGSGGKESAENTVRNNAGYDIKAETATGDKEVRAEPFAAQVDIGNVLILNRVWTEEYLAELSSFPAGMYSDQVDGSSGAFNKLIGGGRAGTW